MAQPTMTSAKGEIVLPDPPVAHVLFSTTRFAWLFTVIRIFLGWQWLEAGWGKVNNPAWMETGDALKGTWGFAIKGISESEHAYQWYGGFLQFLLDIQAYTWFSKLIAVGEVMVGLGLIVGAFVGIAAFFGAFMNWNFIMAGFASTNGLLLVLAVFLMLGWKVAGYYGLDYYLLPYLGTPWGTKPRTQAVTVGGTAD